VISLITAAAADGRLTLAEHSDRVERAYSARTLGELAALTTDLAAPAAQPIRLDGRSPVVGVFGRDRRDGRWVVPPTVPVLAVFGEVVLDLRDALLQSQRVTVYATVVGGTLELMVPDGVAVELNGTSVLTRKINRTPRVVAPGMPVVEVRAVSIGGTIRVISPARRSRWLGGLRRNGLPR
jgi:ferric-dicitrate binding protein FerR (iron transport regulator)